MFYIILHTYADTVFGTRYICMCAHINYVYIYRLILPRLIAPTISISPSTYMLHLCNVRIYVYDMHCMD